MIQKKRLVTVGMHVARQFMLVVLLVCLVSGQPMACYAQEAAKKPVQSDSQDEGAGESSEISASEVSAAQPSLFDSTDKSFVNKYLPPGSYMTLGEIKPGMTGYGLSVFQGSTIEKFEFQVIGVVKKIFAGRDALLIKMQGPVIEKCNVIRGMSGSPVYINNKLVGAVSFGFDFSKEPIAGVTSIVDMLDSLVEGGSGGSKSPLSKLPAHVIPLSGQEVVTVSGATGKLVPLVSPVALAGFSPRAEKYLSHCFKDIGLNVSSGVSGGTTSGYSAQAATGIKPGAAVSVLLSTGDFTTSATGTVTTRFGNKILAFGHPFLQAGFVEFPMSTAVIHKVLPSLWISMKVSSPLSEVGCLTSDRPWGIGGQIAKTAPMIPCSYTVVDETRRIQRTYNCKVIDHPELTPQLLTATVMSAIDSTHQNAGPYVARVESKMEAAGVEPIIRTDSFGTNIEQQSLLGSLFSFFSGDSVSGYVYRTASSIMNNDYKKASLKQFKLKVTLQDGRETAAIERVYVEKAFVAPGEKAKLLCLVRPYNKEPQLETIEVQIPRDAPDGSLVVGVSGGDQIDYIRHRMGIQDPEPESLKEIVQQIKRDGRADELNAVLAVLDQTVIIDGVKINDPPAHWAKVLFSNRHTKGPQVVKGEVKNTRVMPWILSGSHILTIEVKSKDKAAARTMPQLMAGRTGGDDPSITESARKALGSSTSTSRVRPQGQSGAPLLLGVVGQLVAQSGASQTTGQASASKTTSTTGGIFSPKGKGYPHMRLHQIWRQETEEEFHDGKNEGTTVDSWGRVGPGFETASTVPVAPDTTIWSGVSSGGQFYYSTDHKIWRWKGDSMKPELVTTLDTTLVPSVTADSQGTIYAAAVPEGEIYAIDKSGTAKSIYKCPEQVITCLTVDDKDNLYIGTAGNGKVYRLDRGRTGQMIFDSGQAHVTALFYCKPEGKLYVGTAERGAVYSIDSQGKSKAVHQSQDRIVTGVAKNKRGDLYVSTAAQGRLLRVLPSGETQALASSEAFYTLHYDESVDAVFSGDAEGDITLACMDGMTEQPYFMPVCHTEQEAVLALASNGQKLFSGSSNLAALKAFSISSSHTPSYESKVKDAGHTANWVRLRASGPFTEESAGISQAVKIESRTGETSRADETWSAWKPATYDGESYVLTSPAGRFFQYRMTWSNTTVVSGQKQGGPQVGRVDVVYLPRDQAPAISSISLKPGLAVSGKQDVTLTGTDADGDNMVLSMALSSDAGKTWESLSSDIRPKGTKKEGSSASTSSGTKKKEESESKDDDSSKKSDDAKDVKSDKPKDDKTEKSGTQDKAGGNSESGGAGKDQAGKSNPEGSADKGEKKKEDRKKGAGKSERGDDAAPSKKSSSDALDSFSESFEEVKGKVALSPNPYRYLQESTEQAPDRDSDKKDDSDKDKKDDSDKDKDKEKEKADKKKKSKSRNARGSSSDSSSGSKSEAGGTSTEHFSHSWDTNKHKDGSYIVKFVLSDRLSNPLDHQSITNVRAVVVDNTAPEIESVEARRADKDKVTCKVVARDKTTAIANATYRIDEGESFAFAAVSNSLDGLTTTLEATDIECGPGTHRIEVKVSDRAGNTSTKSATVK